ncbi:MAG TPA: chromosomal replication initiator protein DnaA [bacterium]|nr:chromosomal replication initiator protein DnaA [bacterium]
MAQGVDNLSLNVENFDPKAVWDRCLRIIEDNIHPQSFHTWFLPVVPLRLDNQNLTIQVPSQFFYEWLEEHYPKVMRNALNQILGQGASLSYSILETNRIPPSSSRVIRKDHKNFQDDDTQLNSRYTFDHFVEGRGNEFARAAAFAVAEAPGKTSFNPLVIYGGVGLGKTHLIQAIGNYAREKNSARRIRYVSSERFTIEFINSIQNNKTTEFSQVYRNVDLLLVDDIQFFTSKERTQEEFFHTFNTLHQKEKQIVLSSDRPPKELKGLEERLLSRFQWGLVVDIQPPDLETRIAILQKKAESDGIDLSMEIIEYISANITSNIRELEGALIKLLAISSLKGVDIDLDLAKFVLRDIVNTKRKDISIEEIQRVVCQFYDIPDDLLRGKSRKQEIAFARQIAMYLCKEMTRFSLKSIGLHFGGRDHTTVIHAIRTVSRFMKDPSNHGKISESIDLLKKRVDMASL